MRRLAEFAVLVSIASGFGQTIINRPMGACELAFEDGFDGNALDTSAWTYRTDSKHWSTQLPANVTLADGFLSLNLRKQAAGGMEYTGAGVISKREFRYGYYESRFKIPPGKGWHTSFWVMKHSGSGGTQTPDAYQEIDICENDSRNRTSYNTNLHNWHGTHTSTGGKGAATPDLSAGFHVFGCDFSPTEARYYFDGNLVNVIDATRHPHDDASIWLTAIASSLGGTDTVDQSTLPSAAVFDYVRFYRLLDPVFPDSTRNDTTVLPNAANPQLIVDDGTPGFSVDAPWESSTFTKGYQGSGYLTDGSAQADSGRWAKWTPTIPKTASYRVFMRWTSGDNRPKAAPVTILHAEGETRALVDQTRNNGAWVFLGSFLFQKGSAGYVKLDARAPGFTIADAVLFEEQPAAGVRTAPKRPPRRAFRNGSCDLLGRVKPF